MSATSHQRVPRLWPVLGALALAGGALVHNAFGYFHTEDLSGNAWGADDAYISYRYAQNLAAGLGPVFNPGERVEGYSNPLYVVILWLGFLLGVAQHDIHAFATALNLSFAVGAALLFARMASEMLDAKRAVVAMGLFAAAPTIWVSVGAGMETAMVLFLQLALLSSVARMDKSYTDRQATVAGLASAVLVLARADGFVSPLIALVYLLLRRATRAAAIVSLSLLVPLALLSVWRLGYYDAILPNTYYVKVSGSLWQRLRQAFFQMAGILVYQGYLPHLAATLHGAARLDWIGSGHSPPRAAPLSALRFFGLSWLAYWLYVGGDIYTDRFLMILIPIGLLSLMRLLASSPARAAWLIFPLVLGFQALPFWLDSRFDYSGEKYDRWVELGIFLGEQHPGQVLAIDAAGKVPYYSSLMTVDMLGLNDARLSRAPSDPRYLGHGKYDPDYIFDRQPDLIAAWMEPCGRGSCDRLDLILGLSEEDYRRHGYHLAYLVNSTPTSAGRDIIAVSGWDRARMLDLLFQGYGYGVLLRGSG